MPATISSAIASALIPLAGVFQVFDGLQVVGAGILRGIGDTRAPMLINLAGFAGVGLTTSIILAYYTPLGARGLWWGLVLGLFVVAVILLLATAIEPWVSALIVGVVLLAAAGLVALLGRRQIEQATPPKPERAMESVQDDVEYVKERARR